MEKTKDAKVNRKNNGRKTEKIRRNGKGRKSEGKEQTEREGTSE